MQPDFITEAIRYIGASDKKNPLFENQYRVPDGMAYNSYVILDEKIAVMDTADRCVTEQWLENLQAALGGRTPDYAVVSHLEPDHVGSLRYLVEKYPSITLVGNAKTFAMLPSFYRGPKAATLTVKEGDTLPLGKHTLQFFLAPMVHWPEVMVTYEQSEGILFSADAFGKFGALDVEQPWEPEARRYYINIVGKYGVPVQALLKKAAGLDIRVICPLHGPILRENLGYYLDKYNTWSTYQPEDTGVLVAHASIYGNTAKAAEALAQRLRELGEQQVECIDLCRDDAAKAVAEAFRFDRLVLAASSYDGGLFPPMERFLLTLKAKGYQGRRVALVENGAWAPCAAKKMREYLQQMKDVQVLEPAVTLKGEMTAENKEALAAMAEALRRG